MPARWAPAAVNLDGEAEDWRHSAACAGTDPEAFFPGRGRVAKAARRVCAACPVRRECLEHALASGERFGVWGGLSERERREARRRRPSRKEPANRERRGAAAGLPGRSGQDAGKAQAA